ncbi:MAG: heat-inducible transcriptional repressor HrcA [Oscillospiraceae bacterium]|nr:heat-inducible transcriptional repressor HrcA [Oscillospiraceae bacterium]
MNISERKKEILKAIIEDYVETAEPVGSKSLVERRKLGLSSATVRNEMSDLESMGLLEQPHTSSGRVPSMKGYRMYVNELMESKNLTPQEMEPINRFIGLRIAELDTLLVRASKLLSELTNYTSIAITPAARVRFARFELFMSEPNSLVCVMVTDTGIVKSKLLRLSRPGDEPGVRALSAALNTVLAGHHDMTDRRLDEIACLSGEGARYLPAVVSFLRECCDSLSEREVIINGASRLLTHPEFRNADRAHELIEYLSESQEVSKLPVPSPESVKVLIGPENAVSELRDSSVVIASVPLNDELSGIIGVVGPTRMEYSKLISHLSYFTRQFGIRGDDNWKDRKT